MTLALSTTDCVTAQGHRDELFLSMLRGFRSSGGLYRGSECCSRGRGACSAGHDLHVPALSFEWQGELWLPAFQFASNGTCLRPEVGQVIAELQSVYDSWEIAGWFIEPNLWLGNARPVDLLRKDPAAILGAARADRFIATG